MSDKATGIRLLADQMEFIADNPHDPEDGHSDGDERLLMALALLAGDTEYQADVERLCEAWVRIKRWYA